MPPRKRASGKNGAPEKPKRPMGASVFIREFAARQKALLDAMVAQIRAGEISLEESEVTDRCVENVISDWCQHQEPPAELHMKMIAAIFLWALLDEAFDGQTTANDNNDFGNTAAGSTSGADILIEALRTVQAIWGKNQRHG